MILGIDTSCEMASCAIVSDNKVLTEKHVVNKKKHSETLMPMIKEMFEDSGLKSGDISLLAVSNGPGSFTGLRIGMAAAKAMAYALNKRMICIPTPDVLANMYEESPDIVVPLIDARNDQVYTALYKWQDICYEPVTEYMAIHISDLKELLNDHKGKVLLCGDAAYKHHEFLGCEKPDEDMIYPKASACALLSEKPLYLKKSVKAEDALPFYLRVSQAERLFKK